jgi:wyosine [tRNA(Phe)-imidazoG37] synthetase (radical SAM superfamily)
MMIHSNFNSLLNDILEFPLTADLIKAMRSGKQKKIETIDASIPDDKWQNILFRMKQLAESFEVLFTEAKKDWIYPTCIEDFKATIKEIEELSVLKKIIEYLDLYFNAILTNSHAFFHPTRDSFVIKCQMLSSFYHKKPQEKNKSYWKSQKVIRYRLHRRLLRNN